MMKLPAKGLRSQPAFCLSYCNLIDHAHDAKPLGDKHCNPPYRQFSEVGKHLRYCTSAQGRAQLRIMRSMEFGALPRGAVGYVSAIHRGDRTYPMQGRTLPQSKVGLEQNH